jgi:hypothetical protein
MMATSAQKEIFVYADWMGLSGPRLMGALFVAPSRGKEIFSFRYDFAWLKAGLAPAIDPMLELVSGPQYPHRESANFGIFLDSAPDRWGRTLMARKEAQRARAEGRSEKRLLESEFLLGVSEDGDGLTLNISATDNAQDFGLALEVADHFRLKKIEAEKILGEVTGAARTWRKVAVKLIPANEISRMARAFRLVDARSK